MQTLPSADPSRAQSEDMFETGTIEIERPPRTPTSPGNRRPATVARGNARPIEALPSVPRPNQPPPPSAPPPPSPQCAAAWQEATGESPEHNPDRTRIEPASTRPPAPASPASPDPPPTSPSAAPNPRPPTVQVGGGNVGVRSKRVVPLDDPKR
jgi:hypothetical protein